MVQRQRLCAVHRDACRSTCGTCTSATVTAVPGSRGSDGGLAMATSTVAVTFASNAHAVGATAPDAGVLMAVAARALGFAGRDESPGDADGAAAESEPEPASDDKAGGARGGGGGGGRQHPDDVRTTPSRKGKGGGTRAGTGDSQGAGGDLRDFMRRAWESATSERLSILTGVCAGVGLGLVAVALHSCRAARHWRGQPAAPGPSARPADAAASRGNAVDDEHAPILVDESEDYAWPANSVELDAPPMPRRGSLHMQVFKAWYGF